MGLYEGIKDAIGLAQKADNADLIKQLLNLGSQALEMQDEIRKLKEENEELKKAKDIESIIVRHPLTKENGIHDGYPYITLSDDEQNIRYCAVCWGREQKLIQLYSNDVCMECMIKKRNK